MLNKTKISLLFLNLTIFLPSYSFINKFYDDPWKFIEYIFITKPENESKSLKNQLISLTGGGAGSLTAFYATNKLLSHILPDLRYKYKSLKEITKYSAASTSAIASAYISYKLVNLALLKSIEENNLENFVNLWSENRKLTPSKLQSAFDSVYQVYKNNYDQFKEQSSEIIRATKEAIFEQFPEKYSSKTGKNFFDAKYFNTVVNFSIGDTLRGIAKIIEAITN